MCEESGGVVLLILSSHLPGHSQSGNITNQTNKSLLNSWNVVNRESRDVYSSENQFLTHTIFQNSLIILFLISRK